MVEVYTDLSTIKLVVLIYYYLKPNQAQKVGYILIVAL